VLKINLLIFVSIIVPNVIKFIGDGTIFMGWEDLIFYTIFAETNANYI
jgi:alkaline phosphatase